MTKCRVAAGIEEEGCKSPWLVPESSATWPRQVKSVSYARHPWLVILALGSICVFHCSSLGCPVLELNLWRGLEWGGGDLGWGKQEGGINRLQRKGCIPLNMWTCEIARLFHQEHQGFKIGIKASLEEKKMTTPLCDWVSQGAQDLEAWCKLDLGSFSPSGKRTGSKRDGCLVTSLLLDV